MALRQRVVPTLLIAWIFVFIAFPLLAVPVQDVQPINNRDYFPAALESISQATHKIRLILYLAQYYDTHPGSPTNALLEALARAQKRGVDVQVILETPKISKTASPQSEDLSQKNARVADFLMKEGVKVWEDSPWITTHAKVLVVDGRFTILGSTNWTYAALMENNEAAVRIDSTEVARIYEGMFDQILGTTGKAYR